MKAFALSVFRSPSFLGAFGALVIGLVVGRYVLPEPEAVGGNTEEESAIGVEPSRRGSARGDSEDLSQRKRRESSPRPYRPDGGGMTELSHILNTGSRIERTRSMIAFIDRLENHEMAGVLEGFREAGWVDYNRGEYSMLISAWMHRAPFEALNHFDQGESDGWTRKTAIAAWANEDPTAAAAAIAGLEDEGLVNDWVVGLVQGIARNDPDSALATLADLPAGETRNQAIREILPEVVIRGADFASQWIEQIGDPKLQLDAAKRLGQSLARRDPEVASKWADAISSPDARREASAVVSEVYAREDLDGAKEWAEGLPGDTIASAARNITRHLTRRSPTEAASWLLELGDAPALDGARIRFLQEAAPQDPQTALESVSTLSKPQDQERYYRDILSRWRKQDSHAAVAWATAHSASIPPKVLRGILPRPERAE